MLSRNLALKIHNTRMRHHPWLWGVTGRYFPNKDILKRVRLTSRAFKRMKFETITAGGASYYVLEVRDGGKDIEVVRLGQGALSRGEEPKLGELLVDVILNYHSSDVLYIAKLVWNRNQRGRTITVFSPPPRFETISESAAALRAPKPTKKTKRRKPRA